MDTRLLHQMDVFVYQFLHMVMLLKVLQQALTEIIQQDKQM
jgi:hypothetical protein